MTERVGMPHPDEVSRYGVSASELHGPDEAQNDAFLLSMTGDRGLAEAQEGLLLAKDVGDPNKIFDAREAVYAAIEKEAERVGAESAERSTTADVPEQPVKPSRFTVNGLHANPRTDMERTWNTLQKGALAERREAGRGIRAESAAWRDRLTADSQAALDEHAAEDRADTLQTLAGPPVPRTSEPRNQADRPARLPKVYDSKMQAHLGPQLPNTYESMTEEERAAHLADAERMAAEFVPSARAAQEAAQARAAELASEFVPSAAAAKAAAQEQAEIAAAEFVPSAAAAKAAREEGAPQPQNSEPKNRFSRAYHRVRKAIGRKQK